jgi:hypothetical protein
MTKVELHDVARLNLGPTEKNLVGFTRTLTCYANGVLVQLNLYSDEPLNLQLIDDTKQERTAK